MWSDWESNLQPLTLQDDTQPTEPYWSGLFDFVFIVIDIELFALFEPLYPKILVCNNDTHWCPLDSNFFFQESQSVIGERYQKTVLNSSNQLPQAVAYLINIKRLTQWICVWYDCRTSKIVKTWLPNKEVINSTHNWKNVMLPLSEHLDFSADILLAWMALLSSLIFFLICAIKKWFSFNFPMAHFFL